VVAPGSPLRETRFKGVAARRRGAGELRLPFTAPSLRRRTIRPLRMIVSGHLGSHARASEQVGAGVTFGSVSIGCSRSRRHRAGSNTSVLFGGSRSVTVARGTSLQRRGCGSLARQRGWRRGRSRQSGARGAQPRRSMYIPGRRPDDVHSTACRSPSWPRRTPANHTATTPTTRSL